MEQRDHSLDKTAARATRVAQYGGVGGGQSRPGTPGGSSFGGGSTGGGGFAWNPSADSNLEIMMGRARQAEEDHEPERCMETRLEMLHSPSRAEDDATPYGPYGREDGLSFEERRRLRIKREVHRRNDYYAEAAQRAKENTIPYIQEHFKARPEHLHTREELLEARRHNKDEPLPPMTPIPGTAQNIPIRGLSVRAATIPFGIERIAAPVLHRATQTIFDNTHDDNESPTYQPDPRYNRPMVGNTPVLENGAQLDGYLNQSATADWGGAAGPNESTWLDSLNASQGSEQRSTINPMLEAQHYGDPKASGTNGWIVTPIIDRKKGQPGQPNQPPAPGQPNQGQEAALEASRAPLKNGFMPFPLPRDPYSQQNKDAWEGGLTGKEPRGTEDAYPSKNNGAPALARM